MRWREVIERHNNVLGERASLDRVGRFEFCGVLLRFHVFSLLASVVHQLVQESACDGGGFAGWPLVAGPRVSVGIKLHTSLALVCG